MKVNFLARTIELTAEEMRRASAPNSGKYHELLKIMRDLPDFTIEVKHRRTFIKNSNLGLTYEYMEQYINQNALKSWVNSMTAALCLAIQRPLSGSETHFRWIAAWYTFVPIKHRQPDIMKVQNRGSIPNTIMI